MYFIMVNKFDVNALVGAYLYIFDFNIKSLYLIILKFNLNSYPNKL